MTVTLRIRSEGATVTASAGHSLGPGRKVPRDKRAGADALHEGGGPRRRRPRVLVADDHVPTRARVRVVLEQGGFEVCAEEGNARAAVEAALREHPDICLLDVNMPGNGISAASDIGARLPETAVVMLTVSSEEQDVSESLQAGARGYLLKDMDLTLIPETLRAVLAGGTAVPRRFNRLRDPRQDR